MEILITGGTGFIGKALCKTLLSREHTLTVLSRRPKSVPSLCGERVAGIADLSELTPDAHFDAVINLAGEGIVDKRWTPARKQQLLDSRIGTTRRLIEFIATAEQKPGVLVSGSAIGYYGNRGDEVLDESSDGSDGFGADLCQQWEKAANEAAGYGVRVCIVRTGLVIGKNGGFLQRMLPPFKLGLGGRIGDGKQYMSWIHRDDLIALIEFLLNADRLEGAFNGTAPNPVTNREFSATLAKLLKRPALFPVPALVLKTAMGEMAELLLGGQRVMPKRALAENFHFRFESVQEALQDVL